MLRALALVITLAFAGCVGPALDPAAGDLPAARLPPTVSTGDWAMAGAEDRFPILEGVAVPAGASVFFIDFIVTFQGPNGRFELLGVGPDGEETPIAAVSGGFAALSSQRSTWRILEASPGAWSFLGVSTVGTVGVLNVSVAPVPALDARVQGTGADRVVVAIVDTGVNPYHEAFQQPSLTRGALPARILDEAGEPPLTVPLGRAEDYLSTVRADAGVWAAVPSRTLVHFEGTNLLGYELDDVELPGLPVLDRAGHGTAVAHAATRENPDVLIVMITANDYDEAVRWAAAQPWIDLVSLSWGPPVNALGGPFGAAGVFVTPDATRAANDAGKVVFAASGNDPTPTFTDTTSGPIWVHAVSGSLPDSGARATLSGNFVDTVANWTQELARFQSLDELGETSGTSFATPTTAGVASRILHEARTRAGHEGGIREGALVNVGDLVLLGGNLRDALNATAVYWDTTGFSPDPMAVPIAPAPWVSMGWGQVDGTLVPAAIDHLLGVAEAPAKPAAAQGWMEGWARARAATWP